MSERSKLFRKAISRGLDEYGLVRVGRSWVHDAGVFRWAARIDYRYWAGHALEASLFVRFDDAGDETLALMVNLEVLPMASSLEAKQALYLPSNLPDDTRCDRLVDLAKEFGVLLRSLNSVQDIRSAIDEGTLMIGWRTSEAEKLLGL